MRIPPYTTTNYTNHPSPSSSLSPNNPSIVTPSGSGGGSGGARHVGKRGFFFFFFAAAGGGGAAGRARFAAGAGATAFFEGRAPTVPHRGRSDVPALENVVRPTRGCRRRGTFGPGWGGGAGSRGGGGGGGGGTGAGAGGGGGAAASSSSPKRLSIVGAARRGGWRQPGSAGRLDGAAALSTRCRRFGAGFGRGLGTAGCGSGAGAVAPSRESVAA